jgi:acyl carrier protein
VALLSEENIKIFVVNYLSRRDPKGGLDGTQINDSFDFLLAGIIDSMGVLEMIALMEEDFGILVDFELMDPEVFTILGPFCHYVAENAVGHGA